MQGLGVRRNDLLDPGAQPIEKIRGLKGRHRIEEMFAAGNGEAGLDHYEVRSWVGWHHHMTLSLAALWFLCLERRHVGGENPGDHRAAGPLDPGPAAPRPAPEPGRDRPRRDAGAAA
jgi:SRSO17 transposase